MSCNFPKKAFILGIKDNGKKDVYIVNNYKVHHLELRAGKIYQCTDVVISPFADKAYLEYDEVPCGKCIGCKLNHSKKWADRILLEAMCHDSNYFITLTYDDHNLPTIDVTNDSTGEVIKTPTLRYDDFSKFMKRLRKRTGQKLKFIVSGEYGPKTYRPHFHAIIFGLKLDDLKLQSKNFRGDEWYSSDFVTDVWKNGFVTIGKVEWSSACYVANYTLKKLKAQIDYDQVGLEPPRLVCSKGIALEMYNKLDSHFHKYQFYDVATPRGCRRITTSRYYDEKFIDPEMLKDIKLKRKEYAFYSQSLLEWQSQLDIDEQRKINDNALQIKSKLFKRDLI